MIDDLRQLVRLQHVADELYTAEAEHGALPERRAALAAERERAQERVAEAQQAVEEAEADQRRAEAELQDRQALREKLLAQQPQVKSNEAYTALLHEIETTETAISEAETRILEAMESIDAAGGERADAEAAGKKVLDRVEADERTLDERERALDARIAELRAARAELLDGLAAELRRQYERIETRQRPAVTAVRREICQGCRVNIPPQLQIELLEGSRLITCNHCHRILIHETAWESAAG